MTTNTGFFKTYYHRDCGWMWNGYPIEMIAGTELEINDKKFNITPVIQKVLTDTSNIPLKKLNDKDRKIFINITNSPDFENYKAVSGKSKSARYKQSKSNFKKRFSEGHGSKIFLPFNIIDIYTRLEILLGLKLFGLTNTLTEDSNLIDELYKRGELQKTQQNRNALDKFST